MNGNKNMKSGKKRILVVRFSALGDVAMTLPVVYSLARQYPDLQIDFITSPFFARLFMNAPGNITVHGIDIKKEYRGVGGILRLLKRLSAFKPDYVADLHNVLRSWIIDNWFRMKGVKVVMVDKMRETRRAVIKEKEPQPSFFSRYADVFAKLGYPVNIDFKSIFPAPRPATSVKIEHPAVGIAPFARYSNKTYPLDKVEEVVKELTGKGVNIYLFGGRGAEAEMLGKLADKYDLVTSFAGKFPIEEELALIANTDLMVSMDSANHHLASLSGTPAVSIWGSTTPACGFMGYGQDPQNALLLNLDCQPCSIAGTPECPLKTLACMNSLPPQQVVNKILSLLKL